MSKEMVLQKQNNQLKTQLAAKANELKIQTALEKVRAIALRMKQLADMLKICQTISLQLQRLGVKEIRNVQTAIFYKDKGTYMNYEYYAKHDKTFITETSYNHNKIYKAFAEKMQKGKGEFFVSHIKGAKVKDWIAYQKTINVFIDKYLETASSLNYYWYSLGPVALGISTYAPLTKENQDLFKRFLHVFELAYRRYLDIEKAEAQAREAQIETALERVRSQTMAMQHSKELTEVANLLFQQVQALGVPAWSCGFNIWEEKEKSFTGWMSIEGILQPPFKIPFSEVPTFNRFYESRQKGELFYVEEVKGEALAAHYQYMRSLPGFGEILDNFLKSGFALPTFQINHVVNFLQGNLIFITSESAPEAHDIFKRFARVFEQTYTRFLDLQKAEAQAREGQIQLALERVRARTMAMQKQNDLLGVLDLLVEQLIKLGVQLEIANFSNGIPVADWDLWIDVVSGNGELYSNYVHFPRIDHPYFHKVEKNIEVFRNGGGDLFKDVFSKEEKDSWQDYICTQTIYKDIVTQEDKEYIYGKPGYTWSMILLKDTWVSICRFDNIPFSEEEDALFRRFANAFGQAYTRFLDLQKAEGQAREAQIQLALERVRARTMAMHRSEELADVATVLFQQVKALGVSQWACGFCIWDIGDTECMWYPGGPESEILASSRFPLTEHPVFRIMDESRKRGDELYILEKEGELQADHYRYMMTLPGARELLQGMLDAGLTFPSFQIDHYANFAYGNLIFITYEHFPEMHDIFKRFAKVFEQTYTRFLDLQRAEAQAREAKIEAGLERVRSRTLAMQKSAELAETSSVLFRQLIALGISPNRLYISIIKDEEGDTEFWITDEDGTKVSKAYEDNLHNNPSFKKMLDGWKQHKKSLVIDMQGEELQEYFEHLSSIHVSFKDGLAQKRRLQYIAYFSKGFIGMASPDEQPPEALQLLERFAYVFNLTVTRFNDLQIAEAHAVQAEKDLVEIKEARKKAEVALSELQATQKQLIQTEKMASLGELTAGIAHEIQNPLNFVNNFSEVNTEMIEELKTELATGNWQLANEIADDIKSNEQKINRHGKRADAIVKSMLEHSRSSTGIKEPTDINKLADEYLRLSYHGLRAKDKSFNAEMITDFDDSIGKMNLIPQDIGRVLLNLYNNAFYACAERSHSAVTEKHHAIVNARLNESFGPEEKSKKNSWYQPTVWVSTKREANSVTITVRDNGSGIPDSVKEKIFQPFFTTKPTGEGTGLGLSLSYDIIKAHGGEIKVKGKESEGSEFIIRFSIA